MKLKILFLLTFLINVLLTFSQDEGDDFIPGNEITKSSDCSGSSDAFLNKFNVITNYVPATNTPSKIIKINFIIMQKDDGTNNFQNDDPNDPTSDLYRLITRYDKLYNNKMLNMFPSDPISGVADISDPKIKYSLNNIYFYRSDLGNATMSSFATLRNILNSQNPYSVYYVNNYNDNPDNFAELNIYFTEGGGSHSYSHGPSYSIFYSISDCIMCGTYGHGDWASAGGIAHELGHSLDLCHTYLGGGCPTSISSMNSSEDWFVDIFGGPYPGNAPHITSDCSWPDCPPITYPWDEDPFDNTLPMADRLTNNIMGNQGNTRNYLSPSQIGKAHRSLYISSVRQYVIDNCYDSNNPILVNSDEIWDFNIRIYQDLIIDNNAECNIKCHLELPYQAKIVVKSGSSLIVEGSITGVNESNWKGQIEVEPGGELILNDGAELKFGDGGNILIDKLGSLDGNLVYNENALIILEESTSFLELKGQLYLGNNTTFTFTGSGYIKFSNPGGDATNNIFCGSGASIVLQGSGQNDKIVEVQQSSVRFPADLVSLSFSNGKIEMGNGKRMLAEGNYPLTFDNLKITSDNQDYNAHRSFHLYGQANVIINNCVFDYGYWGLYGNLTYASGAPLTILNSEFNNNKIGLYIYNKGLTLTNCTFDENTQVGLHADNMSFVSDFSTCYFLNNDEGINYQGSASADLNINTCEILHSSNGIVTEGGFDLNLNCTYIKYSRGNGIYTGLGTHVNMANNAKNDLSVNYNAIHLDYGFLSANNGYNDLGSYNYAVIGEAVIRCSVGVPPDLVAEHNTWDSNNNPPTYLQNYKLWVINCNQTPVNIIDTDPDDIFCYHFIAIGRDLDSGAESGGNNEILLSGESSTGSLSSQVDNLELSMQSANTATACQQLISESIALMENVYSIETAEAYYQSNRIWSNIHNIIDKHYEIVGRDNENLGFNQSVDQVIQLNPENSCYSLCADLNHLNPQSYFYIIELSHL